MKPVRSSALLALGLLYAAHDPGNTSPGPPPTGTSTTLSNSVHVPPTAPALQSIVRLRTALALGQELQLQPIAVQFTNSNNKSYYADSAVTVVDHSDARLHWLGGRFADGTTYPASLARFGQAVTNGDITNLNSFGLPRDRSGINNGVEFTLPPNQTEFELVLMDVGAPVPMIMLVDGKLTNVGGYNLENANTGGTKYSRIVLPSSLSARTVTLNFGARPFIGLRFPANETVGTLPQSPAPATVVFIGDSITEGAVSSSPDRSWPMQAAYRLGISDPVVSGQGGSGYLARRPQNGGYDFRERLSDATESKNIVSTSAAFAGGAPDAIVIAGGINDCGVAPGGPYTIDQVGTEALAYFKALRAAAPQTLIFVLGPFTDYNNASYSATSFACRDAIFAAAKKISYTYTIDVSDWVTTANRDRVFNGNTYGPHPIDAGHYIYGQRAADAIRAILNRI